MGYKRKARVLFLSAEPGPALAAVHFAQAIGKDWLEARGGALRPGTADLALTEAVGKATGTPVEGVSIPMDATALAWADLLVTLDAQAAMACPSPGPGQQLRHYPVVEGDGDEPALLCERIRRRVAGMVGGMRMLQRAAAE